MDRNGEARRAAMATSNGLSRRRHRTSSPRDTPEDDGPLELQEPARFRDRTGKKDRDQDKERSKRGRLSRSKRRRKENSMHKEDDADDSSEETLNDDDDEDVSVSLTPSNSLPVSSSSIPSSSMTSRKSYPPSSKVSKLQPTWRGPSEKMAFTIPRKARTACTRRAHGEQIRRRASSSPLRPAMAASSAVASPSPVSPSSSTLSMKVKSTDGAKQNPQKSLSKSAFTVEDEIEVAEVLYRLMRQSQGSSKPEEANRSTGEPNSKASSPTSNSGSIQFQDSTDILQNSISSTPPLSAVAPRRKRPRPVSQLEKIPAGFAWRSSPISTAAKSEPNPPAKEEVRPSNPGKKSDSAVDNGGLSSDFMKSHGPHSTPEATQPEPASGVLSSDDNRPAADLSLGKEAIVLGKAKEVPSSKKESADDRPQFSAISEPTTETTTTSEKESRGKEKLEIDHMAPPRQSRERGMDHNEANKFTDRDAELKSKPTEGDEEKAGKTVPGDLNAVVVEKGTQSSTESGAKDGGGAEGSNLNQEPPLLNHWRNDTSTDRNAAQPSSLPLPMSVPPRWPTGLPPMGFVPLQGLVSMEGRPMAPNAIQPPHFLFTQPRPSRCATHRYIAKNISSHQHFMKNYPFWHAPVRPAPLINVVPAAGNASVRGNPNNIMHGPTALFFPLGQQQQVTAADAAASARPSSVKPPLPAGSAPSTSTSTSLSNASTSSGRTSSTSMSFNHPNMPANEAQYLSMLANGAYQFPIPAHVGATQAYRGAHPQVMPLFNGSYHPSQMLHPSRLQQQRQAPPGAQPIRQNQQNPSASVASSSSQKQHTLNQQQRHQGSSASGATTSLGLQNFPATKTQASQTQQQQQRQAFAVPFASMNGGVANLDIASMAKNHAFMQSLPEAARNNYQRMAAAQTAHQRKNHHGFEYGKSGAPDCSNPEDKRKGIDVAESSVPTISRNNVLDSSARSLNLAPGFAHSSRAPTASMSDRKLQKLLLEFGSNARQHRVAPSTSNGSIYSDQHAALATKLPPNSYSGNAQSVVQGSNTQTHPRQWQNSGRTTATQASAQSMPSSMKSMGQQEGITQQDQQQISFGRNLKAASPSQGQQQGQNAAVTPPPSMWVGSPSVSRGHSGSPVMNSSSVTGNKSSTQASSLSDQPVKNSVSFRNGPCVLGKSQMPDSSTMGSGKPQLQQQLSQ